MKKLIKYVIFPLLIVTVALFAWFKYINDSGLGKNPPEPSQTTLKDLSAVVLPACTDSLATPKTDVTYYVAANEPGANNERCDGLAPTNQGGGRCPFKDFTSANVREKLFFTADGGYGTKSVTVKVRKGTYFIHPLKLFPKEPVQPLLINANGQSEAESVVLMNYNGEQAILDGTCPASFKECAAPRDPGRILTLLEIYGSYVIVQGLTFDNVSQRNIQIGANNTHIRCNHIKGAYGPNNDSVKSATDEGPVYIYGNEFSGPFHQAVDATKAQDWILEKNIVHGGTKGFGFKFNARNVIVRNNHFYDLMEKGVDMGADGSSDHPYDYEAYNIRTENNVFERMGQTAAVIAHCSQCEFNNNTVSGAQVGIDFGQEHQGFPDGCRNGKGCMPSANTKIFNNRFRNMKYPKINLNNAFISAESARVSNLEASNNLYCVPQGEQPIFWRGGTFPQDLIKSLAEWQQKIGTDQGSHVVPASDPKCANW